MRKISGRHAAVAALALIGTVGGGVGIASASGATAPVGSVQQQGPDLDDVESETSNPSEEVDGVDCENGIDSITGLECDGGPAANPQDGADDATEADDSTG